MVSSTPRPIAAPVHSFLSKSCSNTYCLHASVSVSASLPRSLMRFARRAALPHTLFSSFASSSSLRATGPSSACVEQQRGAFTKFEAVNYAGRSRNVANAFNPLELNLFDDPTGGLSAGPAEELTTTEIENQVRIHVSSYSRSLFYLLYTPFVDVVAVAVEQGLVPNTARPGEVMCRWFTDGVATLQNPSVVESAMGSETWQSLCDGLDALRAPLEDVMPVPAAVRKYGLPAEVMVPFLRQLAMDLLVPARRRSVLEVLPGLVLGLANGRAPEALGFPTESQRARAIVTADLFMGAGQETGNTDLAYLGLQLLRANDIPVPFPKQKQLTNVFSASTRIQTDWQMRVSGQLVEVLPKWMDYYKKVHSDNLHALRRISEETITAKTENHRGALKTEATSSKTKTTSSSTTTAAAAATLQHRGVDANGVHDYFGSRRAEDVVRLSAIESTIQRSVRDRGEAWQDENKQLPQRYRFGLRRRAMELKNTVPAAQTVDTPPKSKSNPKKNKKSVKEIEVVSSIETNKRETDKGKKTPKNQRVKKAPVAPKRKKEVLLSL